MVRKQIYLRPEQDEQLKAQAKRLRLSVAELIRRRVQQPTELEAAFRNLDDRAWRDARKLIGQRAKMRVPRSARSWGRDDIYEERLARFSH